MASSLIEFACKQSPAADAGLPLNNALERQRPRWHLLVSLRDSEVTGYRLSPV